jgi:hypothetical protein
MFTYPQMYTNVKSKVCTCICMNEFDLSALLNEVGHNLVNLTNVTILQNYKSSKWWSIDFTWSLNWPRRYFLRKIDFVEYGIVKMARLTCKWLWRIGLKIIFVSSITFNEINFAEKLWKKLFVEKWRLPILIWFSSVIRNHRLKSRKD